jgi:hypothetical protein
MRAHNELTVCLFLPVRAACNGLYYLSGLTEMTDRQGWP